ncbi:Pup--protein ligase [Trueperella sp. LYQ143]|uniref:Pup--protein ligase n=1 Tax=unclassified Trueperella TaxID=2630174 RepID=UPI0039839512
MIPRRVIGVETEYGIFCASTSGSEAPLDAEESAHRLFASVVAHTHSTSTFLPNGSRLYLDVGAHPEYATAECDDIADLIANDRAGDAIFAHLAEQANTQLAHEGIAGRIHLLKNNRDSYGNAFGCHENYLLRRRRDFRSRIDALIPFFVTRQLLVGNGYLRQDDTGMHFALSQRADHMDDAISAASTRTRPMINTRDEPHADAERYRRMHVIVGDSSMCQATLALKIGMTEAVLNVLESGAAVPECTLADPVQAIRTVCTDLSGRQPLPLAHSGAMSALDIQREIYQVVVTHYQRHGWFDQLDATRRYVFDLWARALNAMESGDVQSLVREIDWVAKRYTLQRYCERSGVSWDDPRVARLDLAWHDITPYGLRQRLEASGALHMIVPVERIEQARTIPPQTTRAKLRGDFVAAAMDRRRDYLVDWLNLRLLEDEGSRGVLLPDPLCFADSRVDELIAGIDS